MEVGVLGPPFVRGAARTFVRGSSRELVVYLVMHPGGAGTDNWATALWPDRVMAPASLHSTASDARRALGRSRLGHDHLPRGHGRLRLAPTVTSDWARLTALAACDDPASWSRGLGLVRGRPFDGLRSPDWTVLQGIAAEVEEAVVSLAVRVADSRLGAGDGHGAARAARRGLLASPYDERLYRRLLLAADAQGNPAGVESAMARLVGLLAGDDLGGTIGPLPGGRPVPPGMIDLVHPETIELYRSLSRRGTEGTLARL